METLVYYDAIADIKKNKRKALVVFSLGWLITIVVGAYNALIGKTDSVMITITKHFFYGLIIGALLCMSTFGIVHIIKELKDRKKTLFLTGFVFYVFVQILFDTTFQYPSIVCYGMLILGAGLAVLKIITYDEFKGFDLAVLILFVAISAGHLSVIGADLNGIMNSAIIPVLLMMLAAKDIEFESILKVHFMVHFPTVTAAAIAALPPFGLIENISSDTKYRGIRCAMGTTHLTHISGHIFFLIAVWMFLQRNNLKWYHYVLSTLGLILIYFGPKSQLDLLCVAFLEMGFLIVSLVEKMKKVQLKAVISKIIKWVAYVSAPLLAITMALISYFYNNKYFKNAFWKRFSTLKKRFMRGRRALRKYKFSLFGNVPKKRMRYYLDSSFLQTYAIYGIILAVLAVVLISYGVYKYKKDTYFSVLIIILSLNYAVDERLFWLGMNPFMLMVLAKAVEKCQHGQDNDSKSPPIESSNRST